MRRLLVLVLGALQVLCASGARAAPAAAAILPAAELIGGRVGDGPVSNAAFYPGDDALTAPAWSGVLEIQQSPLQIRPALARPQVQGRDARLFPGIRLELFTLDERLVPVQMGEMVTETAPGHVPSYWRVIPQVGRVWREAADGGWSRAALPLMLVSDLENQAQQGLATFLYKGQRVTGLRLQFVQQSAPYLLQHFVAWGFAPVHASGFESASLPAAGSRSRGSVGPDVRAVARGPADDGLAARRAAARAELAARLPVKPWSELQKLAPPGALEDFGGPLYPKWRVATALERDGVLYYQAVPTPFGPYPYPLEMRFGVRSVMKSVGVPLALLRLAQVYGPWVLTLKIGDYVPGLDPKWRRIRFLDAADMATGFGGTGTLKTNPNDIDDGYLEGNYDAWYLAPSRAEKIERINADFHPYPWEPGTVVRYRDQDFFLLGMALDAFLKSVRGPEADLWDMVRSEVLRPIGVLHAPALRTHEADGGGFILCNAGFYPTLDDLAKIAMLYQSSGAYHGEQILNRELTAGLLNAAGALRKAGDASLERPHCLGADCTPAAAPSADVTAAELYEMGFHFVPYVESQHQRLLHLPTMIGAGENEVTLYPNGLVSIVMGNALQVPEGEHAKSDAGPQTLRAVERLGPLTH